MRRVKCVSPHGGCRDGQYHNGNPVRHVWKPDKEHPDGGTWEPPDLDPSALRLPPNPGGYIDNARLGTVAVGAEVDAPDDFEPDGFHFTDVTPKAKPKPRTEE